MTTEELNQLILTMRTEYENTKHSLIYITETAKLDSSDYCYLLDLIHEIYEVLMTEGDYTEDYRRGTTDF